MEKQKNTQMFVIAILAVAILTMSVGFAAYSATLNINGTANLAKALWSIVWEEDTTNATTGHKYTLSNGSVSASSISFTDTDITFDVALEPGQFYEFTTYAKNAGTFNANLTSLTMTNISTYSNYLSYTVTYNGTDYTSSATGLSVPLNAGASVPVKVRVEYVIPADYNNLPTTDNVVVSLSASFGYTQV